jgi:HEAT repeat protein
MTRRLLTLFAFLLLTTETVWAQATPPARPVIPDTARANRVRPPRVYVDGAWRQLPERVISPRVNVEVDALRRLDEARRIGVDGQELTVRRGDVTSPFAQPRYQDDPADSLFRAAHALFSKQEYRAGATRFAEVRTKHPTTKYFCDAAYYEAFARYRLGTPADLRTAYTVLDGVGARCATESRRADLPELRARIDGALARAGDGAAADRVRRAASQGENVCDSEERRVKIDALGALAQVDPKAADPVLRTVLNTKDNCSAPVRRQAISLVARRNDAPSVTLIAQSAKGDPDQETRSEAVRALAHISNDAAVAALEELLRTSNDERLHAVAADALARSDHPRAHAAVRALIERNDVSERLRIAAIGTLAARPNVTHEYWRSLYPRVESDPLRQAIVSAIARSDAPEAQQFLLTVARNPGESYAVRTTVISRVRNTAPINDLYQLLQTADSRSIRLSIVNGLIARKEPEATARLIDIAKTSTDPEVRTAAIRALARSPRKDDPAVVKALEAILAGGGAP